MTANSNTFESGQASGTAISTGNSGGGAGRAFDTIVGTVTYDSTHHHSGTLSMKVDMSGGTSDQVQWVDGSNQAGADTYVRFYVWFDSLPSVNTNLVIWADASNIQLGRLRVRTDGTLDLLTGAPAVMGTTTNTVATGQWVRIEAKLTTGSTTAGSGVLRLFNSPDSTTPTETLTTTATWNTGSTHPANWRFGANFSGTSSSVFWMDDVASSDVDWIGPLIVGSVTVLNQWQEMFGDQDQEMILNPTPGNWLIAVIGGRVLDGSAPMLSLGDVSRNAWTLLSDPTKFAHSANDGAQLQVEVWACPTVRYDGWPYLLMYASAMQISASDIGSVCINVVEISGMTGDLTVDSVAVATASSATSVSVTVPAPAAGADCFMVGAAISDSGTAGTASGTGWTALTSVVDSNPNVGLASARREATSGGTVTFSGASQNWAAVAVALRVAGTVLTQPNPNWPVTRLQIGLGYDLSTPLSRVRWTDQTPRYLSLDSQRGIQAELGTAQQGQTALVIRNDDGAYTPRTPCLAASATAAGTTTTIKVADASAAAIHVTDYFRLKTSSGGLKELNVFQVVSLASAAGTTTITFARADGTAGGAQAATASGDVYAGIQIDLYIPWRLLKTVAGTTYVATSGWLRDLPVTFTDAHWSEVTAAGADAVETLTAADPSALRGEITRHPNLYAYWPLDDNQGVAYAANQSGVSIVPLTQTKSKYGAGSASAAFGASTQDVDTGLPWHVSLFGDSGSGWSQSGGVAADLATKGYALVGSDQGFPPITNGITIFGAMLASDTTPITNASADPTIVMLRNSDPAAGIGQGSIIKVSIDRSTLLPKITYWDKDTHAQVAATAGSVQIAGAEWKTWALTLNRTSWAFYNGLEGLVGTGSCDLVATWSGIDIGGEADQFFNGRSFSGTHAHIAVYGRRLTEQEIRQISLCALIGRTETELASARAIRKLDSVGWRGTRIINNSVIGVSVEAPPSGTVMDYLTEVAGWEDGAVFADSLNQLQYRARVTAYQQTSRATLGDGPGEIPYQPGQSYSFDPTYVYNQVTAENTHTDPNNIDIVGTSTFVATDDTSQSRYGTRSLSRPTRLTNDYDSWHLMWWLLGRYAYPRMRVPQIIVSAAASADVASSSGRWAFVASVEVGDIVTINRRPIGQPMISVRCKVLTVQASFSRRNDQVTGQVTLTLGAAPPLVPICGDPVAGVLGGTVMGA